MWIKRKENNPAKNGIYYCFGTVCKGTEYETENAFYAYYNNGMFTDRDGEDLIGINDIVDYWYDYSKIDNPIL